jgi:Tat protein translocase TatB subunit
MDFFGIGPWEILLILVLALIIMGPGKIPGIARTLGRTIRAIKKASADLTAAVTRELDADREEPPSSQPKPENSAKGDKTPSPAGRKETGGGDDKPVESGEAPLKK